MRYFKIPIIKNPTPDFLENNVISFLEKINQPFWIMIEGQDQSRARVISTLLHGNESSGIKALHRLLQTDFKPAVNMYFFVGAVESALIKPYFSQRYLLNGQDLNRCFKSNYSPTSLFNNSLPIEASSHALENLSLLVKTELNGKDYQYGDLIAKEVMSFINMLQPEAVLDLHNTTSPGEAFAITVDNTAYHHRLAKFFTDKLVVNYLKLGSLMEQTRANLPIVTIECGGAEDLQAQEVAYNGIRDFSLCNNLWSDIETINLLKNLKLYDKPMRLEYTNTGFISFGDSPCPKSDITIFNNFSNTNFKDLKKGHVFAFTKYKDLNHFKAFVDNPNHNYISHYFSLTDGHLIIQQNITIFMLTKNPEISKNDCICYFV